MFSTGARQPSIVARPTIYKTFLLVIDPYPNKRKDTEARQPDVTPPKGVPLSDARKGWPSRYGHFAPPEATTTRYRRVDFSSRGNNFNHNHNRWPPPQNNLPGFQTHQCPQWYGKRDVSMFIRCEATP